MRASVTVLAPAKINLQLGVGAARADGFHALATVYQAIGLHDEVTVTPSTTTGLTVEGQGVEVSDVPTDGSNLALRAAVLLAERAGLAPEAANVAMTIRKSIPVAGGMAGGSTDAAAALVACDVLWELATPREELLSIAADLGSDVPFCLVGGSALGTGRGEVVDSVPDDGDYWWVVALSDRGLSTPEVFRAFDRHHQGAEVPDPVVSPQLLAALEAGDVDRLAHSLSNDLQGPALGLRPDLAEVLALGGRPPARAALLSGSGPTCLFLAPDEAAATAVRESLRREGVAALVARGPVPGARVVAGL